MRSLLDVNVLIARLDSDHSSHARATEWLSHNGKHGWASCPITQNGCIRIMSHSGYPNAAPTRVILERLTDAIRRSKHEFWADDVTLLDADAIAFDRVLGPRQITDIYLLALAVRHGGALVTFDNAISADVVRGAAKKHVVRLQ